MRDSLAGCVLSTISIADWLEAAPRLYRHLFDRPRRRISQSAAARTAGKIPLGD